MKMLGVAALSIPLMLVTTTASKADNLSYAQCQTIATRCINANPEDYDAARQCFESDVGGDTCLGPDGPPDYLPSLFLTFWNENSTHCSSRLCA
ncbi:hypothetical protein ACCC88_13575 [Sphingomonas sp. Sphisp140]|uniref:hypothetical protein n=1 Tax=unclassified Sphingomonas TaxID=196159 RepID=UPI0039AFD7CE